MKNIEMDLIDWTVKSMRSISFLIKYDASLVSDLFARVFLRLKMITSLDTNAENQKNHLRITKLGILESEVFQPSAKQENFNNSKLLSIKALM